MIEKRAERLQVMLTLEELRVLDDWRFGARMPSRAAAIRELLKRGLAAEGFHVASTGVPSGNFGVTGESGRVERTGEEVASAGDAPAAEDGAGSTSAATTD